MPQIFHRSFNVISRVSIFGAVFIIAFLGWVVIVLAQSPYSTNAGITRDQPIPFSHQHHVGDLGIDCRYCHESVDKTAFAGMPSTKTCMNCHQQIWTGSAMLEPVRESFRNGKSIQWERVHSLADFVYFNHSVHVNHGVGCASCHGPVNKMPLMYQHGSLLMQWCLDCHRDPAPNLRPADRIYDMGWNWNTDPEADDPEGKGPEGRGRELMGQFQIQPTTKLTDCSTCHR
jgi:hypothetical protein